MKLEHRHRYPKNYREFKFVYIDAIVMKYLHLYQDKPMELFDNFHEFKKDVKRICFS